ncbi:MAG: methylated-DNA--[protein]-cysteine S-methyltransferase [Kordiimonadaceae bacterium]|nr:methylated-DNA--[protein]-cysteine S-methyltransferase [Kordiimonadaceae bacterium]MBO6567712.1 methylated-DNA--[protein]-cysteine S-methyltransferase [Kordiimonadaceae bacterium]MBO6963073.1 methylated-DNA--[protein]-cysteine S-methyltransferase [Kordiimonadaceae bacterium]
METAMQLIKSEIDSPLGAITLVTDADTVLVCEFADRDARVVRQLTQYYPEATVVDGACPQSIKATFDAYFAGDRDALLGLKTDPQGTAFEKRVWQDLKSIKAGLTDSYGGMAKRLNSSPRAVGRANGRNPIGLIHPCHRVIGADGSLTGYAGGLERKEWLLRHEKAILDLTGTM